jgi:hypothetical protein
MSVVCLPNALSFADADESDLFNPFASPFIITSKMFAIMQI